MISLLEWGCEVLSALCVPDRPTLSRTIFAYPTRSAPTDRPAAQSGARWQVPHIC